MSKWEELIAYEHSKMESAVDQRIRYHGRQQLIARRRKGLWFFADYYNALQSPETGFSDDEALTYLMEE